MSWILLLSLSAQATWSIVAADPETGRVGGGGASCVGALDVAIIYGSSPGVGAVHAQAAVNPRGRDEAARQLGDGAEPAAILEAITAPGFDPGADRRQYGIVDVEGRAATFTGEGTGDWAGGRTGSAAGIAYAAQGNILTGPSVVARTADAFEDSEACDLPGRLMEALTAGRASGEGDARCTGRGIPSDSAFLRVEEPDGSLLIDLGVTDTGSADPLDALQEQFDAWRVDHPCPAPEEAPDDTDLAVANGCGCASAGGGAGLGGLTLLLLGLRRRR